jgi:NhaA family Na+:H+ antiporter
LSWLLARVIFGAKHPAVNFLLLLAVADDGIGMAIIAVFYPEPGVTTQYSWLLLILAGMGVAYALRRLRVRQWPAYVFTAGVLSWIGLYNAHLHPALALIFIVPFIPHRIEPERAGEPENPPGPLGDLAHEAHISPLSNFESRLAPIVDFGLLFFGVTNAGVAFSELSTLTWLICLSLIIGKTGGIVLLSRVAKLLSCEPPRNVRSKEIVLIGLVAGAGLTVALFMADVAFTDKGLQDASKMGALFSAVVFILAPIAGKLLKVERIDGAAE